MAQVAAAGVGSNSMKRIVITGSECTGKTTLAQRLASRYHTLWVPEFSRDYAASKAGLLDATDVEPIARGQATLEDEYAARASHFMFQDTDLLSTIVYSHHYYGNCPPWIEEAFRNRLADLYLLLHPDVPWIADGIRDRGDRRVEMHQLFQAGLRRFNAPYIDITGDWSQRDRTAVAAIDRIIR